MNWTTQADIKRQAQRLWDQGKILTSMVSGETLFPLRFALKPPTSAELANEFGSAREWIDDLRKGASKGYRIVWREVNHRALGRNSLPQEIWIDSLDTALSFLGKRANAAAFETLLTETRERCPVLLRWLERCPLRALEHSAEWSHLLDVVLWLQVHPRPGIYLRQIDLPGVHTKFIESHRGILSELLDLALPAETICADAAGVTNFCRRYGFRDKPLRIRFRMLDPGLAIFSHATEQDITVPSETFAHLDLSVRQVFITENEINFLAFPPLANSLVLFGAGYGFDMLARVQWLHDRCLIYWGDIDTHGFAILDQLRSLFPHVRSLLMDRETLLHHRAQWVSEPTPEQRDLPRLTEAEQALYDDLRHNRLGMRVRLEQEKIDFLWVENALFPQ